MAKKQQIILTHGSDVPTFDKNVVKKGEVLVRHAAEAKDAALYTPNNDETEFLVFPSKTYVDNEISSINTAAGKLEGTVTALQTQVDGIDAAYKAADTAMESAYKAADTAIETAYKKADDDLKTAYEAADDVLEGQIGALDARVTANEGAIADLKAADATIRGEFANADAQIRTDFAAEDTKIREDFAAADTTLKNELNGTISALDTRVTANEGAIADLKAEDTAIRGEFAAEDTAIRSEFAAADATLSGEIAKKADNTTVTTLSGRVDTIQGTDTTKSMREVAAEEAAKEVAKVVANADEDFDTLKEVADWILNDKEGAAALQTDVAKLKEVTEGYEGKGAIKTAVTAIDGRLTTAEGEIDALQAADTAMDAAYKAADTKIREDFAAADTALKTELNGEIAKKADNTTVTTLSGRVDTAEGEIDDLQTTVSEMDTAYKAADTKIREDFAAADTALEGRVDGKLATKADKTTVEAIDGRLIVVEGAYVKTIKYKKADGTYEELDAVENVIDLSGMVIDGGEY